MVDPDDDLRIGMKTSAIMLGAYDVAAVAAFSQVFLAVWTAALWSVVNPWVWCSGWFDVRSVSGPVGECSRLSALVDQQWLKWPNHQGARHASHRH